MEISNLYSCLSLNFLGFAKTGGYQCRFHIYTVFERDGFL